MFFTPLELIIAYSVAIAEMYIADQTLPDAYFEAADRGEDPSQTMSSHILGKCLNIMFKRMSQGMRIRYFRTRHIRDLQLLGDVGVELLRTWFNQRYKIDLIVKDTRHRVIHYSSKSKESSTKLEASCKLST